MGQAAHIRTERRRQADRSNETRAKILAGTIQTVRTHGYANSTVSRVAKTSSVSIGAIQYHFADKDDLMVAMLDHVFEDLHLFLAEADVRSGDLASRVKVIVDRYWDGFRDPNYLVAWEIIATTRHHPILHARVRQHSAVATGSAFELWRDAFSDLEINTDKLFVALQLTLSSLRGLAMLNWVDTDLSEGEDYKVMIAQSLEAQLRALALPGNSGQDDTQT